MSIRARSVRTGVAAALAALVALAGLALVAAPPAAADEHLPPGVLIDNGVVQLGINAAGHLNFIDPVFGEPVGLRFLPTGNEATAPGCLCEGWGVGDELSRTAPGGPVSGWANEDEGGTFNLRVVDFAVDELAEQVTSIVDVLDNGAPASPTAPAVPPAPVMRVTHLYTPSTTDFLYQATVTIENTSGATIRPRYRRVMDWDVEPRPFEEFVTIDGVAGENLRYSSTNGFDTADPLSTPELVDGTYVAGPGSESMGDFIHDLGPDDHGAMFDFGFDNLPPGMTRSFNIFYGAAPTEEEALLAVDFVGATLWSLGQPNTPTGPTLGDPNTFIFGFSAVGTGVVPRVGLRKASENTEIDAGDENGWRIAMTNPTSDPVDVTSIVDVLPPGFAYLPGTSTLDGAAITDPAVVAGATGDELTWTGPFTVPGRSSRTLAFTADSADDIAPGRYHNSVSGTAVQATAPDVVGDPPVIVPIPVRGTGGVAPVVVREPVVTSETVAAAATGSVTEDAAGHPVISMPSGRRSDVTFSTVITCPPGTAIGTVVLRQAGRDFAPTTVDGDEYTFVIPAGEVLSGPAEVIVTCTDTVITNLVGTIVLYDPSGIVTDAATGDPIVGARVTLYKVPFALPDTDAATRDCRTVDTRGGATWAGQPPADIARGEVASTTLMPAEIDPTVNPQLTNAEGRYGWDVAIGCWFVVVEAAGYVTKVSPLVGVPPEVTDLDLALTPAGGGGGGGGGAMPPSPGSFTPGSDGRATLSLDTPFGVVRVTLEGLNGGGTSATQVISAPLDPLRLLLPTGFDVSVQLPDGARFSRAEVCVPYRESEATALGIPERELRLFHVVGGERVDITSRVDTTANVICGTTTGFSPFVVGVDKVSRVAGGERIATSVAVSELAFADGGARGAVLARADAFPDALVGGVLAAQVNGPLLLTASGALSPATAAELQRAVPPGRPVYVLGGTDAVDQAVVDAVAALGYDVERVAGPDRYATSVAVAEMVDDPEAVLVATGEDGSFADALTAGAAAAANDAVVVLSDGARLADTVERYLAGHRGIPTAAIGGPASRALPTATAVVGADRFATAAAVAQRYFGGADAAIVTTGMAFPDALSASTLAHRSGYPVLLVASDVPRATSDAVAGMDRVIVVGGTEAVVPSVAQRLLALLG